MSDKPESFRKVTGIVKRRINELNKSYSMVFVGEPGSGKSLAAIEFARAVDPSFEHNPRVVYNTKDFIGKLQKMDKGQAIIYDEIGLGAAARTFMSQANLMMSAVSQILRFKNILVIFTTPSISFFDINVRMLLNAVVRMESIDYEHEVTYAKYNVIRITSAGTVAQSDFIFFTPDGGREVIHPFMTARPPKHLNDWYDKISMEFKNQTIAELFKVLDGGDEGEKLSPMQVKKIHTQAETCIKLLNFVRERYTWGELADGTGLTQQTLMNWTKTQKLKG
ncbi:MAG: Zonular occludens toxin (Zot) [Methanomethylovorans sp. PtaU1.Bin073]|nr:MAG: Zonular occludens toxin (Zot) [Methanomethylovorans sp. PtaU1.Bin073]